jgi:hypothetical protein
MECKNCKTLKEKRQFSSSGEVTRFLRRLRNLVEDGRIVDFPSFTDFSDVEDDCSWPDVIECLFGCPDCGTEFTFKANSHSKKAPEWLPKRKLFRAH